MVDISNLQDTTESTAEGRTLLSGTKAVIDSTWSVLSAVLGSEAAWSGFDCEEI